MTIERIEPACALCGFPLGWNTYLIKVGEVHAQCMIAFWYGVSFKQPDGTVIKHDEATCTICNLVFVPLPVGGTI